MWFRLLQVLDEVRAVLGRDLGVLAADRVVRDDDLALLLVAADDLRSPLSGMCLFGVAPREISAG